MNNKESDRCPAALELAECSKSSVSSPGPQGGVQGGRAWLLWSGSEPALLPARCIQGGLMNLPGIQDPLSILTPVRGFLRHFAVSLQCSLINVSNGEGTSVAV